MLRSRGQHGWRRYGWQRRHYWTVTFLLLCINVGCQRVSEHEWQTRYQETRTKLWYGYFDNAFREADQNYRRALGQSAAWSWRFQTLKAQALLFQGRSSEGLLLLEPDVPSDLPFDVRAHKEIVQADALCRLGKIGKAEALLAKSADVTSGSDNRLQAELALTRGRCVLASDPTIATQYFVAASGLAHGSDEFIEATALLSLGFGMSRGESYERAIETFLEGLKVTSSPLLKEKLLGNLAVCYAELGDWRRSISLDEDAEKLAGQIGNDGDREKWLIDLGRAHFVLAEFSEAEPYYRQAFAIAKGRADNDALWRSLNSLTELALRRHDLNTAEQYWREESALSLSAEGITYVSFDEAEISLERKEFPKSERLLKEILKSKPKDSLRLTVERELGVVYWQENKMVDADRMFRDAIHDAETVIAQLPPQYRMSFLDEQPFYDSYVRFLVAQNKLEDALKIAERGRAQILGQALGNSEGGHSAFNLVALQALLRNRKQIALAYSLTNEESFLWVITPQEFRLFHLPSHKLLWPQIEAYNNEVVEHPRGIEDSASLRDLYKTLVQPAESLIPKGSRVVVIPSKILTPINFEALVVPGDHPHYWIEDVEVETASSLALLAHAKLVSSATIRKKDLLLLGAAIPADNSLPILKHAAEEMDRVRSHFPVNQETIISGPKAVPQAYRASQPGQYRFIHIDAHSIPSDLSPLDSYIVLSPDAEKSYKLYAHEIEGVRLHAELVTISACYSAGSRWYQGEGIVGLGWAFLHAGAHQVMASLWAVDDASTPQLMDDFYSELTHGKSAAEALRDAKLNMLHSGSQRSRPYYWASLQLYTGS